MRYAQAPAGASAIIRETKGGRPTIQRAGPLDDGPSTRRGRPTIQRAGPLFGWV
ncbi:predicted protein [Plenodomus lingam JN3]|uniref:Uncharacterized protein n=1 Tax=Leptosphaeria maculans (strain JN3 / isolate v23.1.3 / race Av1-4-5-6-7-8) TaxID=985895 RepID=M1ZIK5_LEPMJ|nr:predicted protein [Plenodomus lingam JN3]